jgi:prolyl 4-hydroxylase
MNDIDAERYVNYFIRLIMFICIIQSICIFYNKLILNKNSRKESIELFWNGDNYKKDCQVHKDDFRPITVNNFITDKECDYIISISKDNLQRSQVGTGKPITSNVRTSMNYYLTKKKINNNLVLKDLSQKIAEVTGYPIDNQEPFVVLKYEKKDYYDSHYDTMNCEWAPDTEEMALCIKERKKMGKRVASVIIYLNTVEKGGSTIFPNHGSYVSAMKGKMVTWKNTRFGSTDSCSLHMGSPPLKSIKWILVTWIRDKPWID